MVLWKRLQAYRCCKSAYWLMVLWKRLLSDWWCCESAYRPTGAVKAPTDWWCCESAYRPTGAVKAPETGAEKAPDAAQEPGTLDYGHVAGKGSWWQALSLWGRGRIFQWTTNSIILRFYYFKKICHHDHNTWRLDWLRSNVPSSRSIRNGRLFSTRMHDCVVVQVVMTMSPGKIW